MLKTLIDTEPVRLVEAVKICVAYLIIRFAGGLPVEVLIALLSLAMAGLAELQRGKVWSPSSVRALAERLASEVDG